jgi:hypothetical protein
MTEETYEGTPPDADNPDMADEPDGDFGEVDDDPGLTPEAGEIDEADVEDDDEEEMDEEEE